ncbi:MAG: DUF2339 domain-containing protein, partial [Defluviitaleaceae bacterium]|nr:DUF2339 domain-containing protein [Defluviitaleaceae bacterium]
MDAPLVVRVNEENPQRVCEAERLAESLRNTGLSTYVEAVPNDEYFAQQGGAKMDLRDILKHQKGMLEELETQINVLEARDVAKENEALRTRLAKLTTEHEKATLTLQELKEKNSRLTNALYEQTYTEKLRILDNSQNKLQILFRNENEGAQNRLTLLESSVLSRIEIMRHSLSKIHTETAQELIPKLNALASEVSTAIMEARKAYAEATAPFSVEEAAAYAELRDEQITQEQIIDITKKNNIERFVGLNVINALGILLIIIGAITAGHFVQEWLNDEVRTALIFVLGGGMLAAGEFMNRRKPNVFSLGITAGGVAVLYVGLVVGYFGLEVLPMYPALGLTIVVTGVAFYLSTRYRSQTLLVLAFVGGYLPIFSITPTAYMLYGAMVYFIALNLLDLLVSTRMKWTVSTYIGLFFNMVSTAYIVSIALPTDDFVVQAVVMAFVFFAFFMYTAIPIVGTYMTTAKFVAADIVLVTINTVVSCLATYALFDDFGWNDFTGLLAIAYAVVYLGMSFVLAKKFDDAKSMRDLFFITGMVFVVLTIPFQFGGDWLVLGWLMQGVAVTVYGILKNNARFRRTGLVIYILCVGAFLFWEFAFIMRIMGEVGMFAWNDFAVTFGGLAILAAYIYKNAYFKVRHLAFKYIAILNLWLYVLAVIIRRGYPFFTLITTESFREYARAGYSMVALMIAATFVFGFLLPRLKPIADTGFRWISFALYSVGLFALFILNFNAFGSPIIFPFSALTPLQMVFASMPIVLICAAAVFVVYDFLMQFTATVKGGLAFVPVVFSVYTLVTLTQVLLMHYGFSFSSMWLSFIYVAAAFACIVFGFS